MPTTASTTPQSASLRTHRAAGPSRLAAGAVAGPLFLLSSLAQLPGNPGLDLTRHAFSYLTLGPYGWVQQLTFIATGLLVVVAATALPDRLSGRLGTAAGVLGTVWGAGLVVGGAWPPPPSLGYPAGAPDGYPTEIGLSAVLHGAGFVTGMVGSVALLAVLAAWLVRGGQRRWGVATAVVAAGLLVVPVVVGAPFGTVVLYLVVTVAYLFTAALFTHLAQRT